MIQNCCQSKTYLVIGVSLEVVVDGGGHGRGQYGSQGFPVAVKIVLGHLAQHRTLFKVKLRIAVELSYTRLEHEIWKQMDNKSQAI